MCYTSSLKLEVSYCIVIDTGPVTPVQRNYVLNNYQRLDQRPSLPILLPMPINKSSFWPTGITEGYQYPILGYPFQKRSSTRDRLEDLVPIGRPMASK